MYYVFNNALDKIISTATPVGGHSQSDWFVNDEIHTEIASEDSTSDDDTSVSEILNGNSKEWNSYVTMDVPRPSSLYPIMETGVHLVHRNADGYLHCYRVSEVEVDRSTGLKSITAYDLLLWNLKHLVPDSKTMVNPTSQDVMEYLLGDSDFIINSDEYTGESEDDSGRASYTIDGTSTANSLLQTALQDFDLEIRSYVEVSQGKVINKYVDIVSELGDQSTGKRVEYRFNAENIQRETIDTSLITALKPLGGSDGTTTIADANSGSEWIFDATANDEYNAGNANYLEGVTSNTSINTAAGLLTWGKKVLAYYNHPRSNYTVTISPDFIAAIGDSVRVVDLEDDPQQALSSRVIQQVESEATPTSNSVVLGEFTTLALITPSLINSLENKLNTSISDLIQDALSDNMALVATILQPDGADWYSSESTKRFIGHVEIYGTDVTSYCEAPAFVWNVYNSSGSADTDFYTTHRNDGYLLELSKDELSSGSLTLSIDTDYISDTNVLEMNEDNGSNLFKYSLSDGSDDSYTGSVKAFQYVQPITSGTYEGYYIASRAYKDSPSTTVSLSVTHDYAVEFLLLDSSGTYQSSMVIDGSRHGADFGIQVVDDLPYIWTQVYDDSNYYISRVKYQVNTIVAVDKLTTYYKSTRHITCNYDATNNMVGIRLTYLGQLSVIDADELMNGSTELKYSILVTDFGYSLTDQTFQSFTVYGDYVLWDSGKVDMSDKRMLYCANLVTNSLVFSYEWELVDIAASNDVYEPETVYYDGTNLYAGFNVKNSTTSTDKVEYLQQYPLALRADSSVSFSDDDDSEDETE